MIKKYIVVTLATIIFILVILLSVNLLSTMQNFEDIIDPPEEPDFLIDSPYENLTFEQQNPWDKQASILRDGGDYDVTCFAIFDPYLSGFKRWHIYDTVDENYNAKIANPEWIYEIEGSAEKTNLFTGEILLDLSRKPVDDYIPIPSVAPDANILRYQIRAGGPEKDFDLNFFKDGADNYYVKPTKTYPEYNSYMLEFDTSCDDSYYDFNISKDISSDKTLSDIDQDMLIPLPTQVQEISNYVIKELGLTDENNLQTIATTLYDHFSSFRGSTAKNPCEIDPSIDDDYVATALSKCGCCYVRSFACFITANAIGIPTRLVTNECHAFVEMHIPDNGWTMVQLGGCGTDFSNDNNYDEFDLPGDNGGICPDCGNGNDVAPKIPTITEITYWPEEETFKGPNIEFFVGGYVNELEGPSNPIENMNVNIYINETKHSPGYFAGTGITDENGFFNISCSIPKEIPPGERNILAHALGNATYRESWSDPTFIVTSDSYIVFDMPNSVGIDSETLNIRGILYDSLNSPLQNKNIEIYINDSILDYRNTGGSGVFQTNYDINSYNVNDFFIIRASFHGDEFISPSNSSIKITVKNESTNLLLSNNIISAIRGSEITIEGMLTNKEEEPLKGKDISIDFNNYTYDAKTNNDGFFTKTIQIPLNSSLGINYLTAKAIFQPIYIYAESSDEAIININANTSIIFTSYLKDFYKANQTIYINGTLVDDNNNPLDGRNIKITWDLTDEIILTTDSNGNFSFNYTISDNIKSGIYPLNVEFEGYGNYLGSNNQDSIRIEREKPLKEKSQNIYHILLFSAIIIVILFGVIMIFKKRQSQAGPSLEEIASTTINSLEKDDNYRQAVVNCYRQMCNWLSRQGIHKNDFQTPREFAMASKNYLNVAPETLYTLTQIFEKARYSKHPINIEDKNKAIQCLNEIVSRPAIIENPDESLDYQNHSATQGY